jgi:hypothetical protein
MKPILNQSSGQLRQLLENAEVFQTLLLVAQDRLPKELSEILLGVSFKEQNLILVIEHEAWATKLRFYEPDLLGTFQDHFPHLELKKVKIKVLPRHLEKERQPFKREGIDDQNADALLETSTQVNSDGLKRVLEKLSQHRKRY